MAFRLSGASCLLGIVRKSSRTIPLTISVLGVNVRVTVCDQTLPCGCSYWFIVTVTVRELPGEFHDALVIKIRYVPWNLAFNAVSGAGTVYSVLPLGTSSAPTGTNG